MDDMEAVVAMLTEGLDMVDVQALGVALIQKANLTILEDRGGELPNGTVVIDNVGAGTSKHGLRTYVLTGQGWHSPDNPSGYSYADLNGRVSRGSARILYLPPIRRGR